MINKQLLHKIQDCNLEEIINLLINGEISFDDFNKEFCEEFPTLYLNIIFNFGDFEAFETFVSRLRKTN
jgi:hypothetical protein